MSDGLGNHHQRDELNHNQGPSLAFRVGALTKILVLYLVSLVFPDTLFDWECLCGFSVLEKWSEGGCSQVARPEKQYLRCFIQTWT